MGAKQRAHKRGRGTPQAAKGSLKGSPVSQKKGSSSIQVTHLDPRSRSNALLGWQDYASSASPADRSGFSMRDQARNTERHVNGWGPAKLRDNAITFVSAGHLHQDEMKASQETDEEDQHKPGEGKPQESVPVPVPVTVTLAPKPVAIEIVQTDPLLGKDNNVPSHTDADMVPVIASTDFGPPRQRSPSVSSSDSEQIVFAGRSKTPQISASTPSRSIERTNGIGLTNGVGPTGFKQTTAAQPIQAISATRSQQLASSFEPSSSEQRSRRGRNNQRRGWRPPAVSDEEEAIMQDYIANMAMDDSEESEEKTSKPVRRNEHFRLYDGSGEENMKVQLKSTKAAHANSSSFEGLDQAMDWNSDDLEAFDGISTSEEEVDDIDQVLRHRERESGPQYLVTPAGRTTSDAKWILHEKLLSTTAQREIQIFHEILEMEYEEETIDEDDKSLDSSEDEALNDLVDHIESEDDENARILAHTARMTDEQIAQALAKQEELGMGADELMLFSGNVGHESDHVQEKDAFDNGDNFIPFSMTQHTSNRTRSKRNKKQRDSFPSAAAFADALDEDPYGGFDVMDFDRPSLRPRKKGRKSGFPYDLDLEDEELKDQLVSTWMKDREKKAQRKRDKEEARQAALFDASERGDPAVIKAEIRRFLCQEIEVLRLAPMEPHVRASVHRLAKALRLNSHSEGKDGRDTGRYPVLTKTVRTPSYTVESIWEVDALMNTRKFFPKNVGGYKSKATARATVVRSRRSGGVQGASYMNGEIVGASAPELGADNRGRAMLEKMGWTSGMGIGAEGNKGGLEAIKHVVKTTKAGLG